MSFWEDATGITKGVIALGVVGLLYFVVAFAAGLPPFGGGDADGYATGAEARGLNN